MTLLRTLLLRASESRSLGRHLPNWPVSRRAVRKFMPGETLAEALDAAAALAPSEIGTILTELGENVTTLEQAEAEAKAYRNVVDQIVKRRLDSEPSVKLTHLGLDIRRDACESMVIDLAAYAAANKTHLWIDMEGSAYTEVTLDIYKKVRARVPGVGIAIQAYLRRTPQDIERLLAEDVTIRLVKGAYKEPAAIAYPDKRDVDAQYGRLAVRLLEARAQRPGVRVICGTHDMALVERITQAATRLGLARNAWEVHMLYGIRTADQLRLAASGHTVKVLISYGSAWFAWYMRRLAERPANLWFVLRSMVG